MSPAATATGLPLTVDLAGREVLVVGAGPVSARRARAFVEAGARVTVVAPESSPEMTALALDAGGAVVLHRRTVANADLATPWLVHVATGDPAVDADVAARCEERRLFCVTAGDAGVGTARVPARAAVSTPTGDVRIAVDSGDPRRSVHLGRHVARSLATAPTGLRARRPRPTGWVALVGGHLGAAAERDLLTVRAQRLVHSADVLVVDGGLDAGLRAELDDDVEILDSAEALGTAATPARVAERVAAGRGVVLVVPPDRLATEAEALGRAGLGPEIVPGVLAPA